MTTFQAWDIVYPSPSVHGSYGFNGWLLSGDYSGTRHTVTPEYINVTNIREQGNVPVLLDSKRPSECADCTDNPPAMDGDVGLGCKMGHFCLNRHDGYVNGLFLDWSVRRIGLKELWTLKWQHNSDTAGRWTKAGGVQPEDWPQWMRGLKDY